MSTCPEHRYANPEKKPLGELSFPYDEDGVTKNVPALDIRWAPRTVFTNYVSMIGASGQLRTGVELEEWQFDAECFRDDIEFLLLIRHHEFWSYMVYQKSVLAAIVSFLQNATPFYLDIIDIKGSPDHVWSLYEEVLSLVMRVIFRLVTDKESPEEWITKPHQRELIYKNYLISVPMLFDLVVAVGNADSQNVKLLQQVFNALMDLEPKYKEDFKSAFTFFRSAFRSIRTQVENEGFEGAGGGAIDESSETPYDDVTLYTLDCAYSLSVMLDVCPMARELCSEIKFGQSIAQFYDTTIPFLYKNIFLVNEKAKSLSYLNQARLQFLKAFRCISFNYVEAVLTKPEDSLASTENFVELLTECLSEQAFVIDYERQFPVELDMEILKQACKDMDDFKANFVAKGYKKEAESESFGTIGNIRNTMQAQKQNLPALTTQDLKPSTSKPVLASSATVNVQVGDSLTAPSPTRDIDLEVTAVLDVLPHLGTGFVRRILSRYNNSEEAVAAILEENLPPDLASADQKEEYIPPDPQDKLYLQTGIRHLNVFDGDAYDIMTNDNPNCIIKRGKGMPNKPQNAAQLLDDKSDLKAIRHRYQEYDLVEEGGGSDDHEYEDEYDDSYEALLESETRVTRKVARELLPGLANVADVSDADEGSSAGEESPPDEKSNGRDKRQNFCENPEVVRARYEAARQAKWANKGNHSMGPSKPHNVVGAAKGQGQDQEVLRNRSKKEAHKSSRANHNRKAGAAFKRNKGMMS